MEDENFENFVSGKRIAVVGPAGSIFGSNQRDLIDSYDLVLRFNSALPISEGMKTDVGSRTDILCNCLEPHPTSGGTINPKLWNACGVKWVVCPYPRSLSYVANNVRGFIQKNGDLLKFTDTPLQFFKDIETQINTRPNTGILGIMYLLSFDISELYITGITFARDGYRPGYKDNISVERYKQLANSHIHQQEPQLKFLREILKTETRVVTDDALTKILQENE
jgi:hypothetical protein